MSEFGVTKITKRQHWREKGGREKEEERGRKEINKQFHQRN